MEISSKELKEKINNGEKILVDFWGKYCGPCRLMKPWFEEVAQELQDSKSDIKLYTFDIDNDRDFVVSEMKLNRVPTLKGFKGGKEVYNHSGALRKNEISDVIKNYL